MKRFFSVFLALALLLSGCGASSEPARLTLFAMNTVMDLQTWGPDAEAANGQIRELCASLEENWSASREDSLLSRLNRGEAPQLSKEQAELMAAVAALSERTGGAFDPTLRSVSALWDFTGENPRVPEPEELEAARAQKQWDMGAALKGYTGQKAAEMLETLDVDRAILNLGGNIQTYGEKPDGSPWVIGIQNPDSVYYLGYFHVAGTASVVTS